MNLFAYFISRVLNYSDTIATCVSSGRQTSDNLPVQEDKLQIGCSLAFLPFVWLVFLSAWFLIKLLCVVCADPTRWSGTWWLWLPDSLSRFYVLFVQTQPGEVAPDDCECLIRYQGAMCCVCRPNQVKWHLMIASCYRRSGNYHKALETYQHIHKKFPDNVEC